MRNVIIYLILLWSDTHDFDIEDISHWQKVYHSFTDFGIKPIIIEPMPNNLHEHIKIGDEKRDVCIQKVINMFPIMAKFGINTVCFNFMAHIGWLRTLSDICERGGAQISMSK
ncbi:MAG: mannonate dehydratase [Clostridia bacterium]|nr:mannonate dehydratase [Clostridia bacterium]